MINIRPNDNILQVADERISFCLGLMWCVKELIERQNGTFLNYWPKCHVELKRQGVLTHTVCVKQYVENL